MPVSTVDHRSTLRFINVLEYGVTYGTLANNTARTTNLNNFQNAIDAMYTQGALLYAPPGRCEIYGTLTFEDDGPRFLGTLLTTIVQYDLTKPVVHIGKPMATPGGVIDKVIFDGAYLQYAGTATSASLGALTCSGVWMSSIANLDIGDVHSPFSGRTSVPYRGIYFDPSDNVVPQFSNLVKNVRVKHFSYRGIDCPREYTGGASTGSTFENIYISGGTADGQQDSGSTEALDGSCGAFFQMQSQLTLTQFNVEWCKLNAALHLDVCNEVVLNAFNFEGFFPKRYYNTNNAMIKMAYTKLRAQGSVYDCRLESGSLNVGSVFMLGDDCELEYDIRVDNNTVAGGIPFHAVRQESSSGNARCTVAIRGLSLNNGHGLSRVDDFTFSSGNEGPLYTSLGPFDSTSVRSLATGGTIYPFNNFGTYVFTNATGITALLSRQISATDTCIIPRGVTRRIRANAAGTVAVQNYNAAAIVTVPAGSTYDFTFNGTDWIRT